MARLKPVARVALKRKEFKKPIADYLSGKIGWDHMSLKSVKKLMRILLREEQREVCPYCQRLIIPERRNLTEHIEHFLDKSKGKYRKFAFSATNLVLACQGCNVEKGTRDLIAPGKPVPAHLSSAAAPFLWPHPYFDDMGACIQKYAGPVYSAIVGSGREAEAKKLIKDLKLDDLRNIESRYGRLRERHDRLLQILGRLAAKNDERSRARMTPLILEMKRVHKDMN